MVGFLRNTGLNAGIHLLVHSAFRRIKVRFPGITIYDLIWALKHIVTENGSLIMPAFTYCFKKRTGAVETFNRITSPSRVGAVSELFRTSPDVVRTSSPTHSFSLWGAVRSSISETNSPESPLGKGSVLEWLTQTENSYILMLGVDFTALSYGHYLEIMAPIPWADYSPWGYLEVEQTGVSVTGEQPLKEIPGCSQGFRKLESYLGDRGFLRKPAAGELAWQLIPVDRLYTEGIVFARAFPEEWLCPPGNCKACDSRWEFYLGSLKAREP